MTIIEYTLTPRTIDWVVLKIEDNGVGTLTDLFIPEEELGSIQRKLVEHQKYQIKAIRYIKKYAVVVLDIKKYDKENRCRCIEEQWNSPHKKWTCDACQECTNQRLAGSGAPKYAINHEEGAILFSYNHPFISGKSVDQGTHRRCLYIVDHTAELETHLREKYGPAHHNYLALY